MEIVAPPPFEIDAYELDGEKIISVVVDCGAEDYLKGKHLQLLKKKKFRGNGLTWEGFVCQALANKAPELLEELDFDTEEGAFCAYFKSEDDLKKFAKLIFPLFENLTVFERLVKETDREDIDD